MTRVEIHGEICDGLKKLYADKNADYGDSFAKVREKYPESICIRLEDKLSRLEQLMKPGYNAKVKDESISDTLRDMANYCLMELTEMQYDAVPTPVSIAKEVAGGFKEEAQGHKADDWTPVWALKNDGTVFYNIDAGFSDAEIWYCKSSSMYYLAIETNYEFCTTDHLVQWLDNIEVALIEFVNNREPDVTYKLRWQDGFCNGEEFSGETVRECVEKFSFYADNIIRHFRELEKYGL